MHSMLGMSVLVYLPHLFAYSALEQALLYQHAIDWYAWVTRLGKYKLSTEDWANIKIVAQWLKMLSTAATLMLLSKETTISWSFVVLAGLQDNIWAHLSRLPSDTPAHLKQGLMQAYNKLAKYLKLMDKTPFYMFAACECVLLCMSAFCAHRQFYIQFSIPASCLQVSVTNSRMTLTCCTTSCGIRPSSKNTLETTMLHLRCPELHSQSAGLTPLTSLAAWAISRHLHCPLRMNWSGT
jgi:hypothetical protein